MACLPGAVCGHDATGAVCLAGAAHFLVAFIIGVLGAKALASYLATKTGYGGASAEALCAVLVSVVSVK